MQVEGRGTHTGKGVGAEQKAASFVFALTLLKPTSDNSNSQPDDSAAQPCYQHTHNTFQTPNPCGSRAYLQLVGCVTGRMYLRTTSAVLSIPSRTFFVLGVIAVPATAVMLLAAVASGAAGAAPPAAVLTPAASSVFAPDGASGAGSGAGEAAAASWPSPPPGPASEAALTATSGCGASFVVDAASCPSAAALLSTAAAPCVSPELALGTAACPWLLLGVSVAATAAATSLGACAAKGCISSMCVQLKQGDTKQGDTRHPLHEYLRPPAGLTRLFQHYCYERMQAPVPCTYVVVRHLHLHCLQLLQEVQVYRPVAQSERRPPDDSSCARPVRLALPRLARLVRSPQVTELAALGRRGSWGLRPSAAGAVCMCANGADGGECAMVRSGYGRAAVTRSSAAAWLDLRLTAQGSAGRCCTWPGQL